MSDMQIQQVLVRMRELQARVQPEPAAAGSESVQFSRLLKESLQQVNAGQQQAADLATRFTLGAPEVSLPEVMVSMQKASLQFEAVTQVRNRLIAAYQEVMNMSV